MQRFRLWLVWAASPKCELLNFFEVFWYLNSSLCAFIMVVVWSYLTFLWKLFSYWSQKRKLLTNLPRRPVFSWWTILWNTYWNMRSLLQVIKRNLIVYLLTKLTLHFYCVRHYYVVTNSDCEDKGVNSGRLVACITTLYLFSKIRAQLMVKHAMTIQPHLTTKCNVSKTSFCSYVIIYYYIIFLLTWKYEKNICWEWCPQGRN